jgi:phosphoglycolate phosphatase-like HAD superfamily hydrolase
MAITTVLFDTDGTLVDSNYPRVEAWSLAFEGVGAAVDAWRIHRTIGMDSEKLLEALIGGKTRPRKRVKRLHYDNYGRTAYRLRPFGGSQGLLAELSDRGPTVALATSAPEPELKKLRAVLQIEDEIDIVTSGDDVDEAKPAPDGIAVALEKSETAAANGIMVGDSVWGVLSAANAEVPPVAALSGCVAEAEFRAAGAVNAHPDVAALDDLDRSPLAARN